MSPTTRSPDELGPAAICGLESDVAEGERWLRGAGLEALGDEELRRAQASRDRGIELIGARRTRTGSTRARRLALCGAAIPCRVLGVEWMPRDGREDGHGAAVRVREGAELVTYARQRCRDRWCATCQLEAHRERRRILGEWIYSRLRPLAGDRPRLAFVTFTQRKTDLESCSDAVDRLLGSWRALLRSSLWKGSVAGGFRGLEVVARKAGEKVKKSGVGYRHTVRVSGVHAHIHAVLEVREGVSPGDWWAETCGRWRQVADAESAAQDCQWLAADAPAEVCARHAGEIAGYLDLPDLYELAARAPEYVATVLDGLDGRRLLEAWGSWRGAVSARPIPSIRGVTFATASIASLARSEILRTRVRWRGEAPLPGGALILRPRSVGGGPTRAQSLPGDTLLAQISRGPPGGLREVARLLEGAAREIAESAK